MLLFFYGEDTHTSRQKTQALKDRFLERHPASGLVAVEAATTTPGQLAAIFSSQDLWATHRLVILRDFLSQAAADIRDELADLLERIPSETTVLIWESGTPDKRLKLFNKLTTLAKTQEFTLAKNNSPRLHVQALLSAKNIQASPELINQLTQVAQTDTWMLATEIDKLASAPSPELITGLISNHHVVAEFALQDAIAKSSASEALGILSSHLYQNPGEAVLLVGTLASQLRTLFLIASRATKGLHPFVVRKLTPVASKHPASYWGELIQGLSQLDWKTKTGAAQAEAGLIVSLSKLTA